MHKILIADDVDMNRELLMDIFEDQYEIVEARDGEEAMQAIHEHGTDLSAVLLDLYMPNVDGLSVLRTMQAHQELNKIPVLLITADYDPKIERECLELGAMDFIKKPYNAMLVEQRVRNAVSLYTYKNHLEDKVEEQTAKLRRRNRNMAILLGNLVESRNLESGEHVQRVSSYTRALAEQLVQDDPEYGFTKERIEIITDAAVLHDVGKIAVSDTILLKPGRFTPEEFEIMKTHTTLGAEYLKSVRNIWEEDYFAVCYNIAKYHHERYDGKGYPEGLAGDEIPIEAQLVSVADVYDALIEERCYKKPIPKDQACEMIVNGECGTFSPKILECFRKCFPFTELDNKRGNES